MTIVFYRSRCCIAIVWLFLATRHSPAANDLIEQPLSGARTAAVDRAVETELVRQEIIGLALGVVEDGRIVYLRGYGLADRELGAPATSETVFNWASNSKPLAAVLAMQLVERRQLDLDADVRAYVPEFPEKEATVTTRQLLCHQSGLPHYMNGTVVGTLRTYESALPFLGPVAALDRFNQSPLVFPPCERCEYSSHAYVLLSAVIERAGRQSYADQLRERIARPLEMASLQLDLPQPGLDWAAGYARVDGAIVRVPDEAEYWKHGAGGHKGHIADFARWATALINRRLVSPATEAVMWTPRTTADGATTKYGLGFGVSRDGDRLIVSHNGGQPDVRTRMELHPVDRAAVVVLCNTQHADINAVTAAVFDVLRSTSP